MNQNIIYELLSEYWYYLMMFILLIIGDWSFKHLNKVFSPKIKGMIGEYRVSKELSNLDNEKYDILNNLMLDVNEKKSQIDHVVISNYGIFVIETKNYQGWIFGDGNSKNWTQVLYKQKYKFYNPVWQNKGHIKAIKNKLPEFKEIPYYSIVVFTDKSTLKKINTKSKVIQMSELLDEIKKHKKKVVKDGDKDIIINTLKSSNINNRKNRKSHVKEIKQMLSKK